MTYLTGNGIVDEMVSMQLTGNVIPQMWYKTITRDNGRPHLLAIALLADIVYWYRPQEIRDEQTGQIVGYRAKIAEDLFQRSYDQFAKMFGESKRTVTEAIVRLEKIGVIKRVFRTIDFNGARYNNVLFIELFPKRLFEVTYPGTDLPNKKRERVHNDRKHVTQNDVRATTQECKTSQQKKGEGTQKNVRQITKNTKEITKEIISSSKFPSTKGEDQDDDDIKKQIDFAKACKEYPITAKSLLDELKKNRDISLTSEMFFVLCRNVEEYSGDIANASAYMRTCIRNMANGANVKGEKKKRNAFNAFSQRAYDGVDFEELEKNILSN